MTATTSAATASVPAGQAPALLAAVLLGLAVLCWPPSAATRSGRGAAPRPRIRRRTHATDHPQAAQHPEAAQRLATETRGSVDTPAAMDLLALSLRSGVGMVEGLRSVAAQLPGRLGAELRTVSTAMAWGVDDITAWASVPGHWSPAGRALQLAALAGVPPADLLVQAAADQRRDELQRLDLATARLSVRLVLPLGLAFLPAFVLMTVVPVVLALAAQVLGPG